MYYATQPYTVTVTGEVTDENGGEVVGYCNNRYCNSSAKVNTTGYVYSKEEPSKTYDNFCYYGFIVKYPKSIVNDGEEHILSNKAVANLLGVDGATDSLEKTYSVNYTYKVIEPSSVTNYLNNGVPTSEGRIRKCGGNSYYTVGGNTSYCGSYYGNIYGGINMIENKEDNFKLQMGYVTSSPYWNHYMDGYLQFYNLTLKDEEGIDETNIENYGQTNWKYNLVDDLVVLGNSTKGYERLVEGDYEFNSIYFSSISIYKYANTTTSTYNSATKVTTYNVGWQAISDNDYTDWPEFNIYAKVNGEYQLQGFMKYKNNRFYYREVDSDDEVLVDANNQIVLPENSSGIKITADSNKYSINLIVYTKMSLINSEHVKSIVKNQKEVYAYNTVTAYAEDKNGNIYTGTSSSLPNDFKSLVDTIDIEEYGRTMPRAANFSLYTRLEKGTSIANKWVNYQNDPAHRRVKANYTAYAYDYRDFSPTVLTKDEVFELKVINEQRDGTFYDLLPIGMTVDLDSISVQTYKSNSITSTSTNTSIVGDDLVFTTTLIDNYKNTGRTMLIVKAKVPESINNTQLYSNNYAYSGMTLKFTGYYSWDSIYDYGNNLRNSVAYKSGSGALSNGYQDDATLFTSSFEDKSYFIDLDQDGNPENSLNDTIYAQRTMALSFNTASDSSFKISVKTANMTDFVDGKTNDVIASAGGYYTYKLRYESQKNVTTTNLVIYNDLEKYVSDTTTETWRGRIVNVDVSHAISKGINPVIYYSVKDDLDLYVNGKATIDRPLPSDADLTNNEIWTTEKPSDASKIRAVAIDLGKDSNGNSYSLQSEDSVTILVTMQAPTENVENLANNRAKALNSAWWSGVTKQGNEPSHLNFSVYENTAVVVGEVKAEVKKSSYVESGTSSNPTIIHNGEKIIYDILVSNTSTYESISNVTVVDELPKSLSLIEEELSYFFENDGDVLNSKLITGDDLISYEVNNQKITFEVKQINSKDKLHILIPVKVDSNNQSSDVIKNNASIISFNDIEYVKKTETTYHEAKYGNIKITKKLKYDDDNERKFRIKITLIPPESEENNGDNIEDVVDNKSIMLNSTFSDVVFNDGIGYIELSNNQSKTIENLPEGYRYKIEEELEVEYAPQISNSEGTIIDDETIDIEVVNVRVVNPKTNDTIMNSVIILIISIIGDVLGIYYLRKNIINERNS